MNLDDGDFCAFLVRVLVERDQSRLVRLDEIDKPRYTLLLALELSLLSRLVAMKMNGPGMKPPLA
ncbi:MAG: hypothetical protein ACJ76I_16685 [Gaiellaceae bacterium]